ncbi:hypothetical protein AX769_16775 [Frondihabitans sp. PAMC 28766]|uniref:hypothetical protein n=1 Tax=Frondihabitans sp. PAMC 28766 TaxID=1795630 RepID=UPI00078D58F1|nr:hypothetical protein [Frondihabitans sp. PAMC 28766]AMM21487.1 hypothetical protein AX769_16775 [Frondihabitans sp. PAMC 28766]
MRELLRPLRRRPVWITFVAAFVVGAALFGSIHPKHPSALVIPVVVAVAIGLGLLAAGLACIFTNMQLDLRTEVIGRAPRSSQSRIRRAVARGDAGRLSPDERALAYEYADVYIDVTPATVSGTTLTSAGTTILLAFSLNVRVSDPWSWFHLVAVVAGVIAVFVGVPLQARRLRNATRFAHDPARRYQVH